MKRLTHLASALILLGISTTVLAHPGHAAPGLGAGIAHPFTGLDHLLAMFAVGLWAAQSHQQRAAIWALPATFLLALAGGAALAINGLTLPWVEQGIASSVLALGLLIAIAARLPAAPSLLITAGFGMAHGYAHGLEIPAVASPLLYATGFLLATTCLHLAGVAVGAMTRQHTKLLIRPVGMAIAATGMGMLATPF